ncbi:hypothetical protein PPO43_13130 [Saprospira sp. CCB-QB6]|uniref:hypothetical protein n=1 Tax=Saprospira sp. CCB-QB6 TaxID=3023936 RepID=UPI0023495C85|nr:hypothetical protein [Saprospira sp. CCB-QB6]WCL80912.1 hypothetical protein PPO43_13130 [Saprospira sp. CCB-QB6]
MQKQRLISWFGCCCLLFSYPIVKSFNQPELVFGVLPLFYAYVLCLWLLALLGLYWILKQEDETTK